MPKPKAKISRASIWSHRQQRVRVEVVVTGFPAIVHRKPEEREANREPWILQQLRAGPDFDINISVDLADARRIRDAWVAAVQHAEGEQPCEPDCTWCKEVP
jgi:hypothetical protein